MDDYALGRSGCNRLKVGGSIAFSMSILRMLPRVDFIQTHQNIMPHIRICILINGNSCGGMWTINYDHSAMHSTFFTKEMTSRVISRNSSRFVVVISSVCSIIIPLPVMDQFFPILCYIYFTPNSLESN